jgi:glycosyltransferase involved in cell wall biosynthesis
MMVRLSELITIVIPSKDEKWILLETLECLSTQKSIDGTRVIIADSSEQNLSKYILTHFTKRLRDKLSIEVIEGGYPSAARYKGSLLATTPYILFIDADVHLFDKEMLSTILTADNLKDIDLLTTKISTTEEFDWVFRWFDRFQKLSIWLGSPFAVGSFQLWKTESYWKAGGFNPQYLVAEDYALSKNVKKDRFKVYDTKKVWTYPRRFKNKGVWYMFKLMMKFYWNRNNPDFFKKHHDYWK